MSVPLSGTCLHSDEQEVELDTGQLPKMETKDTDVKNQDTQVDDEFSVTDPHAGKQKQDASFQLDYKYES